jgi:hypothetical protein
LFDIHLTTLANILKSNIREAGYIITHLTEDSFSLRWLHTVSWKVEKTHFRPKNFVHWHFYRRMKPDVLYRTVFWESETVTEKSVLWLLWQQWRFKMAANLHLN